VLCLLGIVRHMAEMERAYGVWPSAPKSRWNGSGGHTRTTPSTTSTVTPPWSRNP
jgi:hypothetical protein